MVTTEQRPGWWRRTRPARGFTLVELLVVLVIIGIVVALMVSVGRYVLDDAAAKKTRSIQAIVMSAIQVYHDRNGEYPREEGGRGTQTMLGDLRKHEESRALLTDLPDDAIQEHKLVDGWDTPMRYERDGGLGGSPVLISAGADREFGTASQPDLREDNIRSDKR